MKIPLRVTITYLESASLRTVKANMMLPSFIELLSDGASFEFWALDLAKTLFRRSNPFNY